MPSYSTECKVCGATDSRYYSFTEYDALPRDPVTENKEMGICIACNSDQVQQLVGDVMLSVWDPTEFSSPSYTLAGSPHSPKGQEALYAGMLGQMRKNAARTKSELKGTKRKDGEMRHIGSIPREMFISRIKETGDRRFWDRSNDAKKTLRSHGLLFDE